MSEAILKILRCLIVLSKLVSTLMLLEARHTNIRVRKDKEEPCGDEMKLETGLRLMILKISMGIHVHIYASTCICMCVPSCMGDVCVFIHALSTERA